MPEAAVVAPQAVPAPQPAPNRFILPDEPAAPKDPAPQPAAEGGDKPAQNSADQAPAAKPEAEEPAKTDQDPENKRQSRRFERRLDKAYRRAAEAEARAKLAEEAVAKFRTQQQPPVDPGAPKLEDFKDIEEYAAAREKHAAEKALKDHSERQRVDAQKKELETLVSSWTEKAESAADKYEDFDEVVGDVKPTAPWAIAAMEADNAVDVMYWLGKNIKEAERIASLHPRVQVREIGKIEAKLLAEPPAKPKTPSKAPAPIQPLSGAAPAAPDGPSENDDMDAWVRKRRKQVYGKR